MAQASHLVEFVKHLIENDSQTSLEHNKKKLKEEYIANGASLNKNLAEKYEQVSEILSVYKYISERVKNNRAGVAVIKDNLIQCKSLLQCNRTDLTRLWLELVEKRHCVKLLEALEDVKLAPELVTALTESKSWFEATLVSLMAQKKINNGLESVQAVLQIRADLFSRQKTLIDRLKSDLHKMIFDDSLTCALKNFSTCEDNRNLTKKSNIKDQSEPDIDSLLPSQFQQLSLSQWHNVSLTNDFWSSKADAFDIKTASQNTNQIKPANPDYDRPKQILQAIYSLYEVGKLQELLNEWSSNSVSVGNNAGNSVTADLNLGIEDRLEYFRRNIFKLIIIKSIEQVKRSAISQNDNRLENYEDCRYLLDLLEILYQALLQCQSALLLMHRAIRYLINAKKINLSIQKYEDLQVNFDELSIRTIIQTELRTVLNAHLVMSRKDKLYSAAMAASGHPNYELASSHDTGGGGGGGTSMLPLITQHLDQDVANLHAAQLGPDLLKLYMGKKRGLLTTTAAALLSTTTTAGGVQVVTHPGSHQSLIIGGSPVHLDGVDGQAMLPGADHLDPQDSGKAPGGGGVIQHHNTLFKFSNSSHAISVTACLQEMRPVTYNIDESDGLFGNAGYNGVSATPSSYPLVSKSHHNNITSIYDSVMEFVDALEIEEQFATKNKDRKSCILREYIKNFIEQIFLKESLHEMNKTLNDGFKDTSLKGLQNLVSQANERELGLQRPIVSIVLVANQCLEETKRITKSLKLYAIPSLRNGYYVIEEFKNNLRKWYQEISSTDDDHEVYMSMEWGNDLDLIRLWKMMPSWQSMSQVDARENIQQVSATTPFLTNTPNSSGAISDLFNFSNTDYSTTTTATTNKIAMTSSTSASVITSGGGGSDIQYQTMNKQFLIINETSDTSTDTLLKGRQTRLLVNDESRNDLRLIEDAAKSQQKSQSSLGIPVFRKPDSLKQLARLHESVAWFSARMSRFIDWMSHQLKQHQSNKHKEVNRKLLLDYSRLHTEIQHLADACLMSIHMEGRIRAYNAIVKLPTDANYGIHLDEIDTDPQINELIKQLSDMEFALTYSLTRHKFRFVFEGLGNFISALFVQILAKIKKMTTSGIKKMCRNIYVIQQTLSVLTQSHEMDLVRVKQLYELLHMTPENVVDKIMEQGAVYDEEVYRNILQIYQQSNPLYSHDKLKAAIVRLGEVINMEYV